MDGIVYPLAVRDLTGHVVRTERYPFAQGGNSDIWKCRWVNGPTSIEVAAKVIKGIQDDITLKRLLREIRVLAAVSHPNISPLLGTASDFDRVDRPCLVFPYHCRGEISGYLKEHPGVDKLSLIAQITNALLYLHNSNIVHGDIKGSNILIDEKLEASIIDFGLARILHESGFTTGTSKGTWRFWAPEMMNDENGIQRVTTATDVYAFAMTVVQILTGFLPFRHIRSDAKIVLTVITGGRPLREHCPQITNDIWEVLEACWDADPNKRPSMDSLAHFFSSKSTSPTGQFDRYDGVGMVGSQLVFPIFFLTRSQHHQTGHWSFLYSYMHIVVLKPFLPLSLVGSV